MKFNVLKVGAMGTDKRPKFKYQERKIKRDG